MIRRLPLNPENLPTLDSLEALQEAVTKTPNGRFHLEIRHVPAPGRLERMKELAASPLLTNVAALAVAECNLEWKELDALLASKHLGNVRVLDLHNSLFGDQGMKKLVAWAPLGQVTHLSLHRTGIGASGLKALLTLPLDDLVHLELGSNDISAGGLKALIASPVAERLEYFELSYNEFGDAGVKVIAASPLMRTRKRLCLYYVTMKAGGLKALLASPDIEQLEDLDISANHDLGDKGIALLAKTDKLRGLRRLSLGGTGMSIVGAKAVAGAQHLAGLERLRVDAGLSEEALDALRASPHVGEAVKAGIKWDEQNEGKLREG